VIQTPAGISIGALAVSGIIAWFWVAQNKKKKKN
jgi:hypothetical protein